MDTTIGSVARRRRRHPGVSDETLARQGSVLVSPGFLEAASHRRCRAEADADRPARQHSTATIQMRESV